MSRWSYPAWHAGWGCEPQWNEPDECCSVLHWNVEHSTILKHWSVLTSCIQSISSLQFWGCWKPKVMSAPHKGYGACLCWTAVMELHMPGSWALVCHGETVFTRKDSVVVIQERDAQLIMYVIYILSFYSTNYDFSSVCLCSEMLSPPSMPDAKRMQKIPSFLTWMALNAENFETLLISCSIPSSFSHKICRPFL